MPWVGRSVHTILRPRVEPGHTWVKGNLTKKQKNNKTRQCKDTNVGQDVEGARQEAARAWEIEGPVREAARGIHAIFGGDVEDNVNTFGEAKLTWLSTCTGDALCG